MKKSKIKVINAIIIAVCMALTVFEPGIASAKLVENEKTNSFTKKKYEEDLVEATENNIDSLIVAATMDWVEIIEPEKNLCVGDIIEVNVDGSDEIRYMASLFDKSTPYGYVVVGFRDNEVVVMEANVNKGQEGMYTELVEDVIEDTKIKRKDLDVEKKVVELAPMQYAVEYKDKKGKKKVLDNFGEVMDAEELTYESTVYDSYNSIFIWGDEWTKDKYKVIDRLILKKYNYNPRLRSETEVETVTRKYACGVQALLQIAYMDRLTTYNDDDVKETYNTLWKYTNTRETQESKKNTSCNKIVLGKGNIIDAADGYVKFAKEKGYKKTEVKGIERDPSVEWIKDKLKYNRTILMGYGIKINKKEGENIIEERSGHFISILGYVRAQKVSSGNTWNYLMVYDGWNTSVSYINYTCVDFMDCEATYFWVK